jgi:20S proteasome alpha/beta subunit
VGLVSGDRVFVGADSMGSSDYEYDIRSDPKVFRKGRSFLIGFCGSFRVGQLVQCGFTPPRRTAKQTDFEYMVSFSSALKRFLHSEDASFEESSLIVAYRGKLYCVFEDFQVSARSGKYDAIGSGSSWAKGAVGALLKHSSEMDAEAVVRAALEEAELHSTTTRGPFTILSVKY